MSVASVPFGINFFSTVRQEQKAAEIYFDEALRLSVLAEELGFSHVRTVEHYFRPYGGMTPSPIVFLTAVAARTTRVRLVTGAVLPIFNHPIKVAGETAMLDCISRGRLDVGFGRAFLPEEFDAFQRSMDESRARFEGGIAAVKRLWTETDVVYEDDFYRFGPITSSPRPVQKPHPPIVVAAVGTPASFEWTGRQGYRLMVVPYLSSFEALRRNLALYREAFAGSQGRAAPPVQLSFHMHVAETDARAIAASRLTSCRASPPRRCEPGGWGAELPNRRGAELLGRCQAGGWGAKPPDVSCEARDLRRAAARRRQRGRTLDRRRHGPGPLLRSGS